MRVELSRDPQDGYARARFTIPRNRCDSSVIQSAFRDVMARCGIRSFLMPKAAVPASMNCVAVCWCTPPGAIRGS